MSEIIVPDPKTSIVFSTGKHWIMKLTREGIFFNKQDYPYSQTDDFAKAVIDILEENFDVKFYKK